MPRARYGHAQFLHDARDLTMTTQDSNRGSVTIRAENLSKIYGDFAALHSVSFEVRRGTVAAFLGPNGAGKSTTMKILTGYLAPTTGRAQVLGFDPSDPDQRIEMSRRLGYLPENGPLYADMTPRETLEFVAQIRGLGTGTRAAVDRVVSQCAIEQVMSKPIAKLSKGYRQRVGMAQALLHDPEVLILDEPTGGLDPNQVQGVRELIGRLRKTKTLLLSTHILREVQAMCDRVVLISKGRIVYDGAVGGMGANDAEMEDSFRKLTAA